MKLPEPSPDWQEILRKDAGRIAPLLSAQELSPLMKHVNSEYLPWEKAKYVKLPPGVPPEHLWVLVMIARSVKLQSIPLLDTKGRAFRFWLPDPVQRGLHLVDQKAGGRISSDYPDLPSEGRDRYLISSLMEEAIASSQIEGAATTRKVAKEMLRTGRPPVNRAERMIRNNYTTIQKIKDRLKRPLTIDMLHDLQRSMTEGTLDDPTAAGRFRTESDEVVVIDESDGQILHVPPPAADLPARMEKFLAFANDPGDDPFIHPVVRAILLHFWLAYEHPYVDGNGRTARAVFYWYMLSRDYWLFEFLSISRIIHRAVRQYGKAFLHSETDGNDATYFLAYHMRTILLALEELHLYLRRKQVETARTAQFLGRMSGLNHRQQALLRHALKHPDATYTILSHRNSHNIAYGTSRSDLLDLVKMRLLVKKRTGGAYRFTVAGELGRKLGLEGNPPMLDG
jgi:Fic family protein